jgi:hypothetical protein
MNRQHLQEMANLRLNDASNLMASKSYSAAYYLLGYAVEFGLKSCISRQISANTIPDKALVQKIFTHDFDTLIGLAGLRTALKDQVSGNQQFAASWAICKDWTPEARYATWCHADALALYEAITDNRFGVLPWIKTHW